MKSIVLPVLAALFVVGCADIRVTDQYHGVRMEGGAEPLASVEVENSGWELFKCLPIASGDPNHPNMNECRWFTDTVTLQSNLDMLDREMHARGTTRFTNLTSRHSEENFLFILLTCRTYHTSAILLKDEAAPRKKAAK